MSHFNEKIITDSINFIDKIIEAYPNKNDLPDLEHQYIIANKDHLIFSLNNKTAEHLDKNSIENIQAALFKLKNYFND